MMTPDPRTIANFVLDTRDFLRLNTTQIELQKLLYFSYETYLLQTKKRLMKGYFEAWQYGPVHPTVYKSFKHNKGRPIRKRAVEVDVFTGKEMQLPELSDPDMIRHIVETVTKFSRYSASQMVALSHAKGGPWHSVVESANKNVALGLRITDNVILTNRAHSMLMREGLPAGADEELPDDESPLTRNRFG